MPHSLSALSSVCVIGVGGSGISQRSEMRLALPFSKQFLTTLRKTLAADSILCLFSLSDFILTSSLFSHHLCGPWRFLLFLPFCPTARNTFWHHPVPPVLLPKSHSLCALLQEGHRTSAVFVGNTV